MELENWKWVSGFEGLYEVSSLGAVRSFYGGSPAPLRAMPTGNGYRQVNLCKEKRRHAKHVHVLVAQAFLGDRPAGFDVSHLNGCRSDNRATNLTYESHSANCARRREHGTAFLPAGEAHHNAKLTQKAVERIFAMRLEGAYQKDIAAAFGVTQSNISRVLAGKQWAA